MPDTSKACGFVLTRSVAAGTEYLLLTNRARGEPGLPKGHAEEGETELETALRETAEETGLADLEVNTAFRRSLRYMAKRKGRVWDKTAVYFLARTDADEVRLSKEHASHEWARLGRALAAMPFEDLRQVVRDAALYLKDPALFDLEPATEQEADAYLTSLPEATESLVAHLRGGARLARRFATALADAGVSIHVEAAAAGTLLHDAGRAIGEHADHQRAGLRLVRETPFAAYGFACISHFTKGASPEALRAAGLSDALVDDFTRLIDPTTMTWEERCAALADACMKQTEAVHPRERFADLRERYDAPALIDLQERRTEIVRREIEAACGSDPLALAGLA